MRYPIPLIRFALSILLLTLPVACNLPNAPPTQSRGGTRSHDLDTAGKPPSYLDSHEANATRRVLLRIGDRSQTFTLTDLQAFPKVTIADYEPVGVKRGSLGKSTWTGASLKDVLLTVDPTVSDSRNNHRFIVITSSDKWVAIIKWVEIFGSPQGGEALYNIKGCNECHGVDGEGTAPRGKRPAPALARKEWSYDTVRAIIRTGKDAHAGINPYAEPQLSDTDLRAILDWLRSPRSPRSFGTFTVDPAKIVTLLAYERDNRPMTGKDGLIQLIVGMDEFAGRYSHWVQTIEVK